MTDLNASPILTDPYGRFHNYLRISLTERCNLRCFYCMPAEGIPLRPRAEFMTAREVLTITRVFSDLGVTKIRLTGGEPLVRKDAAEIIEGLSKLPVELAITTNGILLDRYMEIFEKCGLRSVNISLDSLREEKFNEITRRNYYERVFSNITEMLRRGFHVKLNAVMIRGVNDYEIMDFIDFTRDREVHFRFIEFMPFSGNQWEWSKGISYREILMRVRDQYGDQVEKLKDGQNDTAKNYRIKGYKGTFAVISSVTNPFCDTCNRLRLTADGKLKNCLFSNEESDLLSALRAGEDIVPRIEASVRSKKARRAGMESFKEYSDLKHHQKNRAMVAIGG